MKLLIVDDHAATRRLIKIVVHDLFSLVAECDDGADALAAYEQHQPDWVGIMVVSQTHVDINGPGVVTNFGRGVSFSGVDFSEIKEVTSSGNFHGFVVERDFVTPDLNNLSEKNWFRAKYGDGK